MSRSATPNTDGPPAPPARRESDELQLPGLSAGQTTALIVGLVAGFIIVVLCIGFCRNRRRRNDASGSVVREVGDGGAASASESDAPWNDARRKSQVVFRSTSV